MTTEVAAAILDCTPGHVAYLCRVGRIAGRKVRGRWVVRGHSVRAYRKAQR